MTGLNDFFKHSQWILLSLTVVVGILSIVYADPDKQTEFLGSIGITVATPSYDMPTIIPLLGILWLIFLVSQTSILMLKVASDRVIAEGMDRTESCTGSKLHTKGDFCWVRAGGTKIFSIEGSSVWINPLTHTHRIGHNIVMEAHLSPDTDLSDVPPELKIDINQRRKGFFGVNRCSVGLLSSREMRENTEFDGSEYEEAKTEEDKRIHTTSTFIADILSRNRAVDILFLLFNDDAASIEKKLASVNRIGAAAKKHEKKGLLDFIMSSEGSE